MSYTRPSRPYVKGVHYRPIWAEDEVSTGADAAPPAGPVTPDRFGALFPGLSTAMLERLCQLYRSYPDVVPYGEFGSQPPVQSQSASRLRVLGILLETVRGKGYRLTEAGHRDLATLLKGRGA